MKSDKIKRVIELFGVISALLVVLLNVAFADDIRITGHFNFTSGNTTDWNWYPNNHYDGKANGTQIQSFNNYGSLPMFYINNLDILGAPYIGNFASTASNNYMTIYSGAFFDYNISSSSSLRIFSAYITENTIGIPSDSISLKLIVNGGETYEGDFYNVPITSGAKLRVTFVKDTRIYCGAFTSVYGFDAHWSVLPFSYSFSYVEPPKPPTIDYDVFDNTNDYIDIGIHSADVERFVPVLVPSSLHGVENITNYILQKGFDFLVSLDPLEYIKTLINDKYISYSLYYDNYPVGVIGNKYTTDININGMKLYYFDKYTNELSNFEYYVDFISKVNGNAYIRFDSNNINYVELSADNGTNFERIDADFSRDYLLQTNEILRIHVKVASRLVSSASMIYADLDNIVLDGYTYNEHPIPTKHVATPTPTPIPTLAQDDNYQDHNTNWLIRILNALLNIPQKITDLLGDLLKYLFVPKDFTNNLNNSINNLEQSIGILGFPIVVARDIFAIALSGGSNGVASLHIPSIDFMGAHFMDSKDLTINVSSMCGGYFELISSILLFGSMLYFVIMTFRHFGLGGDDV